MKATEYSRSKCLAAKRAYKEHSWSENIPIANKEYNSILKGEERRKLRALV